MDKKIKIPCADCFFFSKYGCTSKKLCIRGSNHFPTDDPNISYKEVKAEKMKIEFTLHDLGAAFCNFNKKCFAACAECAAFINGFCGGEPSAADLEEIGAEIVKEWKERSL